jgi:hypothetical protein
MQMARFTTAPTHIIGACVDVVELVCKAVGGTAVYQKAPFDRCLRDILTMNQHVVATLRTYEMAGRLLLGIVFELMRGIAQDRCYMCRPYTYSYARAGMATDGP